jgi:ATP-dependent DNA ligase
MSSRDKLLAGFIVPAQPVQSVAASSGADWVQEIKHDGYQIAKRSIGRHGSRPSPGARRFSRPRDSIIDGEAVVIGPDGLTDFEALRCRGAGDIAVLYAFDSSGA